MLSDFQFRTGRVSRLLGISALMALLFIAGCTTNNGSGGGNTSSQFAVTTTSGQLATVVINSAYPSTTLTASNGTAPYTWSITAGALPTGLTLSSSGVLSGAPTAFGTFNFTVTVMDSASPAHTASASLSVLINPAITSVALNPTTVNGGVSSTGTITLSGTAAAAATVTLSSNSASATVPATATVAAGSTTGTFTATTTAVSATTAATITATYGVAKTAVLTVNAPTVSSLVLTQPTVTGGSTTTGTVTLSGPAASGGDAVTISSTNAAATPAATATVLAGATTAQFNILTTTVATTTNGNIQASFNSSSQSAALSVVPAPAITSFTAASSTISSGSSTTLTAVFSNGTGSVSNGVGAVTSGTPVTVSPTATTTYTLTVTNAAGTAVTQQTTVTVTAAPAITSFTAAATTISAGSSTTLTAVFTGGTGSVNNSVGAVTSGTAVTVSPASTTTYTLTVSNTATPPASVTSTVTVIVVPLPVISSFTAGSTTIVSGNSTTLTPVFSNGAGSINTVGTVTSGNAVTVSPTNTITYTLTVTNSAGSSVTSSVTITVTTAPNITSIDNTSFLLGANGTFTVMTTGSPTPALSETGALPSAVTFVDNGNGTATIGGIPAVGTAGSYPITITANNGVTPNATQSFTLTVTTGLPSVDVVVPGPPPLQAGGGKGIFTITVANDQAGDTPSVTFTLNGVACTEATCGSFSAVGGAAGGGSYSMLYTPPATLSAAISPTVTVTPSLSGQFFAGTTSFTVYPAGLVVTGSGGRVVQTGTGAQTLTYTVYNDTVVGGVGDGVNITITASGYTCSALNSNSCGTLGTPMKSTSGSTTTTTVTYTPPSAVPAEPYDRPLIVASSVAEDTQFATTPILISSTPQAAPLSIPFNQKLDSALTGAAPITISANGNDPGNTRTVTWTIQANGVACASPTCGTLGTPVVTTNGTNVISQVTYTPPASVPTGSGQNNPTIIASFTDNPSATDSFNLSIANGACGTGSEAVLTGNYAFLLRGGGANVGYDAAVGSFVANGSGTITSGFLDTNRTTGPMTGLTITGTYSVGSDNRGCMTLTNSNGGTFVYRFALGTLSGSTATQGNIIAFGDDTGAAIRAEGVLMQQNTSAFQPSSIDGTYVFGRQGVDVDGGPFVIAGLFTANGAGAISGLSADYDDYFTGAVNVPGPGTGTFTLASNAPGGRGTSQTTISGVGGSIVSNYVAYVVSPSELLSMSTDLADANHPIVSGEVKLQTGPFTATTLDGNGYVVSQTGIDGGNGGNQTTVGQATVTTNGAATVILDQNDNGVMNPDNSGNPGPEQNMSLTFEITSTGRATISGAGSGSPVFYLIDSTQAFFVGTNSAGGSIQFGYFQKQTGGPFSNTTLPATAFFGGAAPNTGSEFDVGAVTFNTSADTISGTDDESSPSGQNCSQNCNGNGLDPNSIIGNNGSTSVPYTFTAVSNASYTFTPTAPGQGLFGGGDILAYSVSPTKVVFMQIGQTNGFGGFTPASETSANPAELYIGQH